MTCKCAENKEHYCEKHGLRYTCPDCATDKHTQGRIESDRAEIRAENERMRKALGSNRQFLEEMVTAGGKHSDINGTSVVEPAYRQLTLTEQALEGREG